MPTPEELQQDSEFMSATPADQIKYLSETDPDFKAAHSDDQAAYLAHVTKQPTQAEDTGGIAGAVKTALNYYTGQAKPPVMHVEAAPKQAKQATEETDPYAGMSEEDQKAEAALESQAGAPFHPRAKGFEQLSAAGAKLGGQITEGLVHGMGETPVTGFEQAPEHVSTEEFEKQHPKLAGASKGVGEFAGGMVADPRMWAFALLPEAEAAPLLNTLVSGAFAAQMGSDAVQGAKDLGENWDKMSEMDRYNAMSKLGLSTAMAGVVGEHAVKGSPAALKEMGEGSVGAVRAGGRGMQKLAPHVPGAAAALGVISGVEGGPASMYFRGKGAGYLGKYVAEPFERGANAMATFRMPIEDKNVEILTVNAAKADKAAKKAADDHAVYAASEEHGAIDPETNPAYKKSLDALNKARAAQAEAHFHLQEAKAAAQEAAANKSAIEGEGKEITPAEVNAARPETSTPTNEELNTRQNKLMSEIEKKAGVEQPAPTPENVKLPGQVQPETFPQEPTEAPRVDETTRMRPLGGDKGVLVGRKPLQLGEGTSEAAPAAPEAPKAPLGEILPPEKSATAAEMAGLKAIGGQVVEAPEKAVGPLIKQGLAEGSKAAKPKATPTEAAPVEASKPVEEKVERSPEDETKLDRVLFQLTNQEQLRLGTEHGVNEAEHNLSEKSKDEHRLPVGKKAHVEATKTAMPEGLKDAIVSAANDWDNKNTQVFDPASMSSAHGAERSRAILKEAQRRFNLEQEKGAEEIAAGAEKGKSYGKSNKFVTKEEADTAVKSLNEKLTRSNAGFDPTAIADAVKIGAYHFEAGLREFGVWSKQMTQDLGDKIKPHLDAMWKTMQGGGEYKGVQEGVPEANLKGLVLFDHPETGSTLALPEDQVTPEAVKEKLTAHKEAWDKVKNEEIANEHNENGGSSVSGKGKLVDGYSVGINKELEHVVDKEKVTAEDVKEYRDRPAVQKALKNNPAAFIGTWVQDGKTYFDTSVHVPDLEAAKKLGIDNKQLAIFDLKNKESINLEPEGVHTPGEVESDEEMARRGAKVPEEKATQNQKEMSPEERAKVQEELAAKGQSGGSQSADEKISKALIKHASKYADAVGKVEQGRNDLRFILNDGSALYTDQPHYIVSEMALEKSKLPIGMNEDDNTHDFMNRTGSVRIAGENGFHVEAKPTPEQIKSLATLAKGQKVYFTVGDTEGQGSFGDFQRAVDKEFPEKSEAFKSVKNMTEAEKEALAAKGQSGASGKEEKQKLMPTGDDLIKKYGESSGDPAHTSFILPDGRGVDLPHGVDHDTMLGGKATDQVPRREQFIDQGNIRIRPRVGKGGREFSVSIPESGITENQLSYLKKMAPQMSSGTVMVEIGKRGGAYKEIPYGKASADLESTLRALAPIKEAEKRLPDLAEKHLTPEERQGVTKSPQQQEKFLQRMEQMPEVREWADAASKGAGERKWYQRSTQAFDAMSKEAPEYFDQPGDRDKFIGMLASGSPQQSVAMNMREALRVWTNYVDNGRPTGPALEKLLSKSSEKGGFTLPGAKIPNAMKALAGEPLWPDITKNSHFKVPSFRDNLTGMLDRVTNDGWMALFAGLDAKDISKAHSYHPLSVMTRAAAEELGWEPAEAQAAIWAFIKTLTEKGVDASEDPHEMRQHSEDFADIILHDPETRALLKDMGVDHAKLDERLAREVEQKPEPDSGRKSPTGEDSARRAFERVETARGKGTIPPPKTGLLKFGEPEPDEATSFNPEEIESGKGPKQLTKNASGESAASQEAINRAKSEKRTGTKYFRIDSRSGRETPIIGAGALDSTAAGPYEHIVRRGPDGEIILDSGNKARPLGIIKRQ